MTSENNHKWEELRLTFSINIEDIRELKGQQWKVTNYVLLLDAAIFGVMKVLDDLNYFDCWIICLIIFIVTLGITGKGDKIIREYQEAIENRRDKIDLILQRGKHKHCQVPLSFSKEIRDIHGDRLDKGEAFTDITNTLRLVQWAGFAIVLSFNIIYYLK